MSTWMIYGAEGYMGRQVLEVALQHRQSIVLAGRSGHLLQLAREKELPCRVFSVETVPEILPFLQKVDIFIDCAGPYTERTSAILRACSKRKIQYLDLSMEYVWSQRVWEFAPIFEKRGCWAVTGVSSYALLSEYLAGYLKGQLPNITSLDLTYTGSQFPTTKGCLLSYLSILACGQKARSQNRISTQWFSASYKGEEWGAPSGASVNRVARRVPLVDLVTVWIATRIPFISTFVAFSPSEIRMVRVGCTLARFPFLHGILLRFFRVYLQSRDAPIAPAKIRVSGRAENAIGQHRSMQIELEGPDTLTVKMICDLALLADGTHSGYKGVFTAGQRLGTDYLFSSGDLETRMHHLSYGDES